MTPTRRRSAILLAVLAVLLAAAGAELASSPHRASRSQLVWDDEFTGPAGTPPDDRRWRIDSGYLGAGNAELEYDSGSAANVALNGHGQLAITARRQRVSSGGRTFSYTSGRLETRGLFQTRYGQIEARIELPSGQGLWPAFWALGTDVGRVGWPAAGEIDVMENHGGDSSSISGSLHGPESGRAAGYSVTAVTRSPRSLATGFHDYGITWSPDRIAFTLDGRVYAVQTPRTLGGDRPWVFNAPFYLLLDLAVGGREPGDPDPSTRFPATMLVDWVRVYH